MLSLYEILKASKTGIAPDMWTALAGANFGGADSGAEVKELTGIPPLSFTANGTPLLDFLISGNMSQTGTPTHDSPIMPQETGERTGNLFDMSATNTNNGYISDGYLKSDGSKKINGDYRTSEYIAVSPNQSYMLQYGSNLYVPSICFYDNSKNFISGVAYGGRWAVLSTTPQNTAFLRLSFRAIDFDKVMLNAGSTALPYEPYGYKIPISSASTTTPVYLGDVETTRKIKKLVLTGEENLTKDTDLGAGARYYYRVPESAYKGLNFLYVLCTHYTVDESFALNTCRLYLGTRTNIYITVDKNDYPTIEDYQAYLAQQYAAGTPVTIWYVLATEETGIVNEPLRKIGDYADTLSMEQAGVSIPTLNGQTVVDVDTTLKPSEVYIKYKG